MSDMEYLSKRSSQHLAAAIQTSENRVRLRHLELADAYAFRLKEEKAAHARNPQLICAE